MNGSDIYNNCEKRTTDGIKALAKKYPWFDAARRAAASDIKELPAHILLLGTFRPSALRTVIPSADTDISAEIIDLFLSRDNHKIVPDDNTPEYAADEYGSGIPDDEELTEELAEIYLKQGLFNEAIEIYGRLSLLYPKKSVYFAEIIEKAKLEKDK